MSARANPRSTESRIAARARTLGFDAFGITDPTAVSEAGQRLRAFLADGRHGDMDWLAETETRRADPLQLMPAARSVIAVGLSYAPSTDPLQALDARNHAVISVYAKGRDYHDILKGRLKQLAGFIAAETKADLKVFVDTAPIMEKPLAAAAGLGWQGRHTNLVSRDHGSWLFLGLVLSAAALAPDAPESDHCGTCRRCLDICPTDAFPAPYQLDARRCIAYLTIEHRGHIPLEFRQPIGNRVFGCDDCLAVCPWNKFAAASRETRFAASAATDNPPLADILSLDEAAFRRSFAGTPVKRTGRARIIRNALIAAGNSGNPDLLSQVIPLLDDGSALVRAMAVWALATLASEPEFAKHRAQRAPGETDTTVAAEWARLEPARPFDREAT
ncbi:MAG: tRNA epoxyqueuosine(34) reductase QueG [Hyphomicrobiaceae bacterium]|nr:tRNA epoxyqueuosine(34) reductase QueG [Hyphomicrobiaceae bacterium]